jgi:ElaB/YqjD/DUF883 family membrane-anchored ribosome-binding protein
MVTTAALATRKRKNGQNGRYVQARLNSLRRDLDALQQDMRGLVTDVGEAASGQVHSAVNGTIESASEAVERVSDWSNENLDGMRQAVRLQPLAACAISMSAGALIGALLLR